MKVLGPVAGHWRENVYSSLGILGQEHLRTVRPLEEWDGPILLSEHSTSSHVRGTRAKKLFR